VPEPHLRAAGRNELVHANADAGGTIELLRATIETAFDGLIVTAGDGASLFSNAQFLEMWGISASLVESGEHWILARAVAAHALDPEAFLDDLRRAASSEGEVVGVVRRRDGSVVEWSSRPLTVGALPEGRVWRFRDVSRRVEAEAALQASEERYRTLLDASPLAIAVHQDGRFVFANPAAARLLGAESEDRLLGMPVMDVVHPDYRQLVQERHRSEIEDRRAVPWLEQRFVRLDGVEVDVEVAGLPFVHEGRPAGQIIARDITDQNRARAIVLQRSQYLAALHETTLNVMNRLGVEDVLHAMVARAAGLVGSEHGFVHLVEEGGEQIELRVATGAFRGRMGRRLRPGEGLVGKVWRSGEVIVVQDYDHWNGRSARFPSGMVHAAVALPLTSGPSVVGVIGVAHVEEGRTFSAEEIELLERFAGLASVALDNARLYTAIRQELGERERIEHDLRLAEAKYRTLVEQIPAVTYTAGFGLQAWTYVSPHIEAILGFAPDEWMADNEIWYQRIHPDDREAAMAAERRTQETGVRLSCEYRMLARDGRIVWIRDEGVVVQVGGQRVLQGIMFDITERKRAEDELERALQREREAAQRLRSLDEMKNTFLHAVSHELRTPLSAVLGFALTLERADVELPPEERAEILHRIATNARKLDHLLSDLLDLDRLDRGIVEPRRRPTNLAALIARTVANSGIGESRRVEVQVEPIEVFVDGPKVERMVENLLVNAARHTPVNSAIWVRAHLENGGVVVAVEDEGAGVPSDIREAIFEPFRQGPDTPQHAPGVGIGLSLVARFAELHGGRAWCEEREGGGASFRIYIPDERPPP
jgi:PAS domain S-box-containing protein